MTRFDTKLAHVGRTSAGRERTVNPPLTRASTILFDSVAGLREARAAGHDIQNAGMGPLRNEHAFVGFFDALTNAGVARTLARPVLTAQIGRLATFQIGGEAPVRSFDDLGETLKFKELVVRLPNEELREKYRRKAETTLTLSESTAPKDIAEYQWRITTPVGTILLALIAVPLARSAPRRLGGRIPSSWLLAFTAE